MHDTLTRTVLPATHLRNCPRRQHPTERSVGHVLIVQVRSKVKGCLVGTRDFRTSISLIVFLQKNLTILKNINSNNGTITFPLAVLISKLLTHSQKRPFKTLQSRGETRFHQFSKARIFPQLLPRRSILVRERVSRYNSSSRLRTKNSTGYRATYPPPTVYITRKT